MKTKAIHRKVGKIIKGANVVKQDAFLKMSPKLLYVMSCSEFWATNTPLSTSRKLGLHLETACIWKKPPPRISISLSLTTAFDNDQLICLERQWLISISYLLRKIEWPNNSFQFSNQFICQFFVPKSKLQQSELLSPLIIKS